MIAQEALVIDCDFLLLLLFPLVSPKASDSTSYTYLQQESYVLTRFFLSHYAKRTDKFGAGIGHGPGKPTDNFKFNRLNLFMWYQ